MSAAVSIFRRVVIFTAALSLLAIALAPISWGFLAGAFSSLGHILGVAIVALAISTLLEQEHASWEYFQIQTFVAAAASCLIWVGIELVQAFVPNHGTELGDVVWDMAGFLLGLAVIVIERRLYLQLRKAV